VGDSLSLHLRGAIGDLGDPHQDLLGLHPRSGQLPPHPLAFDEGDPKAGFSASGGHGCHRAGADNDYVILMGHGDVPLFWLVLL